MSDKRTISREEVLRCVYATADEINQTLPSSKQVGKTPETQLFGHGSVLDSLGLVNFIVALEQRLTVELGTSVVLADDRAMSRKTSPFRSVQTLTDYILELIGNASHDR